MPAAEIGRFVSRCRERGLEAWISGRLESPDVPRLLPLNPDVLCFGEALRSGNGKLDPAAIAVIRGLIPRENDTPREAGTKRIGDADSCDKLIVRDFVLPMFVGAYGREREKPQRVCFNVVAEINRRSRVPKDMRDVFSYDIIVDAIRRIAGEGHVDLLETLAERIAQELLLHPDIARVTLKLEKLDIGPAIVGIEIVRKPK
jgi:dihydroneopterin aldolase